MILRNWLSAWKFHRPKTRNSRPTRRRSLGHPQPLEIRTLLSAISFTEQTGAANPLNGVDLGTSAAPTLGNLDGDGDLDLIAGRSDGTFVYYKNTGTSTAPVFTEQTGTNNPLNGVDVGSYSKPALGNLDGDGDLDLVVGRFDGTFAYFKNTGTSTAPVFTEQTGANNPFNGFDAGEASVPTLKDLDGDGDLDLIAGEDFGTFKYYRNTGTPTAPVFTELTGANNPLDGVDVGIYSAPELGDLDGDGDLDLIAGIDNGKFRYFRNTGTATAPAFTEQTGAGNPLDGVDLGVFSVPALGNLNGVGGLDLIAGNEVGNFSYFLHGLTSGNTAPVLNAGFFPQLPGWWRKATTNPGDTVANIINSVAPNQLISDPDIGTLQGFAVIDATNLNGTWEYSTDDGITWNSLADTSTTNARLLNEAAKLRFVPFKKKFKGDFTLTVVAWDQTSGTNGGTADVTTRGGTTAFSLETSLITQTVLKKKPKI